MPYPFWVAGPLTHVRITHSRADLRESGGDAMLWRQLDLARCNYSSVIMPAATARRKATFRVASATKVAQGQRATGCTRHRRWREGALHSSATSANAPAVAAEQHSATDR